MRQRSRVVVDVAVGVVIAEVEYYVPALNQICHLVQLPAPPIHRQFNFKLDRRRVALPWQASNLPIEFRLGATRVTDATGTGSHCQPDSECSLTRSECLTSLSKRSSCWLYAGR